MNSFIKNITFCYQIDDKCFELNSNRDDVCFDFIVKGNDREVNLLIIPKNESVYITQASVKIEYKFNVSRWRNHDYRWVDLNTRRIANEYSPKIFQLSNGSYVQAGQTLGCWEVCCPQRNLLHWHLHKVGLKPVFYFDSYRKFYQPKCLCPESIALKLIFTSKKPLEWSRSPYPFSAIFCLTDHCDFDSLLLLKKQREFLRNCGVRISKGFFMYHFSKRDWNVSLESKEGLNEIKQWERDGHELFYHSLSQSIRNEELAWRDFNGFQQPELLQPIKVWVDHGYQPYNFTMQKGESSQRAWLKGVISKGVSIIWNYYDTFEDIGSINQIGIERFCAKYVVRAQASFENKLRLLLYYYSSERDIRKYGQWVGSIKKFAKMRGFYNFLVALKNSLRIVFVLVKHLPGWVFRGSSNPIPVKYAPMVFDYAELKNVRIFQTLAIKNFASAFSERVLDEFVSESGFCIAHTYLSVMARHHPGRLFINEDGEIREETYKAWMRLGDYVKRKKIWNPTLSELVGWMDSYKRIVFDVDENGTVVYRGPSEIATRRIDD